MSRKSGNCVTEIWVCYVYIHIKIFNKIFFAVFILLGIICSRFTEYKRNDGDHFSENMRVKVFVQQWTLTDGPLNSFWLGAYMLS